MRMEIALISQGAGQERGNMVKNLKRTILSVAIAIAGSAMFAFAQSSRAQPLPKDYENRKLEILIGVLDNKQSREVLRMYVAGALEGIEWVNSDLAKSQLPKIFCAPPRLVLNADNAADIIVREYAKNKDVYGSQDFQQVGRAAVSLVLLMGLKDTFPCK